MKKILKNRKGITLVALIITIIILLILAGITISQLSNSGLFDKTKVAKEKYENAEEDENDKIAKYQNEIDNYIDGNRNEKGNGTIMYYPDYSSEANITFTNKSYTVENDGYIQVCFRYSDDVAYVDDRVFINDKLIYINAMNSAYCNTNTPLLLVKKGDVIKYTNTAHSVIGHYYPFR